VGTCLVALRIPSSSAARNITTEDTWCDQPCGTQVGTRAEGRQEEEGRTRAQHKPIISSAASMTSPVLAGSTLGLFAIMFACTTPGGASGLVSYARTRRGALLTMRLHVHAGV
jgi:hypothetical protein